MEFNCSFFVFFRMLTASINDSMSLPDFIKTSIAFE
jgi:hypothetical protein